MRFPAALLLFLSLTPALATAARADAARTQDVCVGGGTAGPYPLRWTHVLLGSETVQINGLPQTRGLDYTLDAEAGTVTFTRPLPALSAAAVSYGYDAATARRNAADQTVPLSLDLLRGDRGYFSLDALGRPQAASGGDVTLGLGLGVSGGRDNRLSSRLTYSPLAADSASGTPPSRRLGLAVSGAADAGQWGLFSFGLARVGSGVRDAGDGLASGRQRLDLKALLTPTKVLRAEVSFDQSQPTDDPHAQATTESNLAVTLTPSDATSVAASVAQTETGKDGQTQTVGLSLDARPAASLQVSAAYSGKDAPGSASDTQDMSLKSTLTPGRTLSFEASAGQSRTALGLTDRQAVSVTLMPRADVRLDAGLSLRQTESVGRPGDALGASVASVAGSLRPLSFLELSGTYKSRAASAADADPGDSLDTSIARVAFSPVSGFRVVGTYAQNPDDGGDTLQRLARRGLGVETRLGALGLSGGYDWSRASDSPAEDQTVRADLGLRFSAVTQLSVGFQSRQNLLLPSAPPSTAYTLDFTHALGDRFSLSLNGRRSQEASAASPDYNASAKLGMKF